MEAPHTDPGEDRVRLELELQPRADGGPIAGVLRGADRIDRPFEGWLELATLLERAPLDG